MSTSPSPQQEKPMFKLLNFQETPKFTLRSEVKPKEEEKSFMLDQSKQSLDMSSVFKSVSLASKKIEKKEV